MPPTRRRPARASASSPRLRTAWRVCCGAIAFGVLALGFLAVTVPDVRPLRTAPPADTAFMRLRQHQAHAEGRPLRQDYRFVPYARIAQTLKRAVLVTEDSGFWEHEGIELEAMKESLEASLAKGTIVRGGSTITQQLAKNLYLTESRDPLRKVREIMIAHRLERVLGKTRILELYLNVVEWGDDTWGAEAASRHYFRKPASALGASEAALLAGALINPNVYNPGHPPRRLLRRQSMILRRMQMRDAPVPPPVQETVVEAPAAPESPAETAPEVPASESQEPTPTEAPTPDTPSLPSSEELPARPATPVPRA